MKIVEQQMNVTEKEARDCQRRYNLSVNVLMKVKNGFKLKI
jgi:hypothetical protein